MVRTYFKYLLMLFALAGSNSYASEIGSNPANPIIALLKMSLALAIVLVVLWLFMTLLKRFQSPNLQSKDGLKLISSFSLGQRDKLLVVQVGDEQLLLGVSSSAINKLHVLSTPLNLQEDSEAGSFKKTLNAAINRTVSS